MSVDITPINLGISNCYLLNTGGGFVLVDTGAASRRAQLEAALAAAGCQPGNLALILLTHGDFDHSANAEYLRDRYGAPVALHADDVGMIMSQDMRWGRKPTPDRFLLFFRIISILAPVAAPKPFQVDHSFRDEFDLAPFGLTAEIIPLPGHSKGSVGVLTEERDLICGDLLMSVFRPQLHFLIDDMAAARASIESLKGRDVRTVYPGHGRPFPMIQYLARYL
ncbi:MAG: MBL fold metallo-hydrolase [Chloroflexi bacterium]|nr:MBL fold metallo-hydrolase [Chloroflexota bacterium]